jgi:hypothetical protein
MRSWAGIEEEVSDGFAFKRRTRREPQTVLQHGKANQRGCAFEGETVSGKTPGTIDFCN